MGMSRKFVGSVLLCILAACDAQLQPLRASTTPVFDPEPGAFDRGIIVKILAEPGHTIMFTADGSEPTREHGYEYQAGILINGTDTLKAIAFNDRTVESEVATGHYSINVPAVIPPEFDPEPGVYEGIATIGMKCRTPGATIYFTIDGSDPQISPTVRQYFGPFDVNTTTQVKAYAMKNGMIDSETVKGDYQVTPPGLCYRGFDIWCMFGTGHVSTYVAPYTDVFNNDFTMADPTYAWCTSGRMWLKDLAGTRNDHVWLCQDGENQPTGSWYDANGTKTLEAEFIFCSCERGANHGRRAVADCKARFTETDNPECRKLLSQTAYELEGGIGYWRTHDLLTGEQKNYYKKRANPSPAPPPQD